jgi:hypothetical protein
MEVMGQSVTVTADTMFETDVSAIVDMASISAGNIVEISGYTSGDGNITATYVEVKAASFSGEEMEVKGLVSNLNETAMTFEIGSLLVDYGSAELDLSGISLANGLYVEVKTVSALSGNTMTASKLEIEGDGDIDIDVEEGSEIEIKGPISEIGADYIVINGQTIYFTASIEAENGLSFDTLSVDMVLEVDAYMDGDGRLVAMEIESEQEDDFSIRAHVESVDTVNKTITILGQTIAVNSVTMMKDERDLSPVRYFSLSDLSNGDWVKVKFYRDDTQGLVATYLERDDDESSVAGEFKLEGLVEQITASSFSIGGIEVALSEYPSVTADLELEVSGTYVDGSFTISSVSLDN